MYKQIALSVLGVAAATALSGAPVYATGPVLPGNPATVTVHVVSSPDDGTPPWARDTFDRKTSITSSDGGHKIVITDTGSFKTPSGVHGKLTGEGTFKVTGGTRKETLPSGTIDRSGVAVKDSFTGEWWKQFVTGGTSNGITEWKWTYTTDCETRVETPAGAKGERPSKFCSPLPKPIPSKHQPIPSKPVPSHSASASPSASVVKPTTEPTFIPSSVPPAVAGPSLPLTGPPLGLIAASGGAIVVLGAAALMVARRRNKTFQA